MDLETLKNKKVSIGTAIAIAMLIAQYEIRLARQTMAAEKQRAIKEAYLAGYQAHLQMLGGRGE